MSRQDDLYVLLNPIPIYVENQQIGVRSLIDNERNNINS